MTPAVTTVVVAVAFAMAAWSLVLAARNKLPGRLTLGGLAVVELALLVQLAVAIVLLAQGHQVPQFWTFLGYLVASLIVVPVGAVWALSERTRWSSVVLAVACVVVPILVLRLNQIWGGSA
ncbi:hypothetical protein [Fodinicola feengrottensis]|uniref:Integral membrane protein n=1 Tax=Fodinicola feengrottensis TaxID=435914 RepID=A0ABN2HD92_9ACTN|nr:hypothetical protein [Fodinicola feengrottensis]